MHRCKNPWVLCADCGLCIYRLVGNACRMRDLYCSGISWERSFLWIYKIKFADIALLEGNIYIESKRGEKSGIQVFLK